METNNVLTLLFGVLATTLAVTALLLKCRPFRGKITTSYLEQFKRIKRPIDAVRRRNSNEQPILPLYRPPTHRGTFVLYH